MLESPGGLRAVVVDGGAPASLGTDRIELVQHAASAFAPGLVQLWLRDRATGRSWPMLGAGSGSAARVEDGALVVTGRADDGLGWRVTLTLDPTHTAWAWHVEVLNDGPVAREVDVVHAHDVALAAPGTLRTNELYVSQYLDIAAAPRRRLRHGDRGAPEPRPVGRDPVVRARLHDPGGRVGDRRARRARPGGTGRAASRGPRW